jgi:inhibitor of cysteine peptidase
MPKITVQIADSGRTISVALGDEVAIELPETPTTGYRWSDPVVEGTAVKIISNQFIPPSTHAAGAAGRRSVLLRVTAPGRASLSTMLARAWQGSGAPTATFHVTFDVTA